MDDPLFTAEKTMRPVGVRRQVERQKEEEGWDCFKNGNLLA